MTDSEPQAAALFDPREQTLERHVESFEGHWSEHQLGLVANNDRTSIDGLLGELVETDLELRLKQRLSLDDYLRKFPQLREDKEVLARLVFTDYRLRANPPAVPAFAEYLGRFPEIRNRLVALAALESTRQVLPGNGMSFRGLTHDLSEANRYSVVEQLDAGGRGSVALARDHLLDRLVCVKQIHPNLNRDKTAKTRFLSEALVTGKLEHPSIVPVYGIGTSQDGLPFYSMRFVRGVSLKQKIREFHEQTFERSGDRIVAQRELIHRFLAVCNAVHYAHEQGVLHRDLKPANIMVGDYGQTFVVDWGLAKHLTSKSPVTIPAPSPEDTNRIAWDATTEGEIMGSPSYMSPEQARGEVTDLDVRTDVYGLGAVLYELLTGRPPFSGHRVTEVVADVRSGEWVEPRLLDRSISRPLNAICSKALAHDKDCRYASARELSRDLEQYLADQSVSAYRESSLETSGRLARANQSLTLVGVVALLMIAVGSFAALVTVNRQKEKVKQALLAETESRQKAEAAEKAAELSESRMGNILDFTLEILRSPHAMKKGHEFTVAAALAESVDKSQEFFANDARTRAKFLNTFAETFRSLGLYGAFAEAACSAYEVCRDDRGEEHHLTLQSKVAWADALLLRDNTAAALPIYESVYQEFRARYGDKDKLTIKVANGLGYAYLQSGSPTKAVDVLSTTTRLSDEVLGKQHALSLSILNNLALAYERLDNLETALQLHERSVERRTLALGSEAAMTLLAKHNLGCMLLRCGRLDEGLSLLERVLEVRKTQLPPNHPHTLGTINAIAGGMSEAGDHQSAIASVRETIAIQEKVLGLNHQNTAQSQLMLAKYLERDGQYAKALVHYESVARFAWDHATNPKWEFLLIESTHAIPRILLKDGQADQAKTRARKFLTRVDQSLQPQLQQWLMTQLGEALLRLGEPELAKRHLNVALSLGGSAKVVSQGYTPSCAGEAFAGVGDFERAEELLLAAHETLAREKLSWEVRHYASDNRQRLVRLYEDWGKSDLADRWRHTLHPSAEADEHNVLPREK